MRANRGIQAPSKEVPLVEYMRSKEVYRSSSMAIVVDAFRHVRAYIKSCVGATENDEYNKVNDCVENSSGFHVLFFLSHFHSDHYDGITSAWHHGHIYASRQTANLLCWELGVEESCVRRMDFFVEYVFSLADGELLYEHAEKERSVNCRDGCFSVRLIPANHCPGAAMFLFDSSTFGTILHTGDFRFNGGRSTPLDPTLPRPEWESNMADDPVLKCIAGHVNVLYLDNTYCDPRFEFPNHAEVLREVNHTLRLVFSQCALALQRESGNSSDDVAMDKHGRREKSVSVAVLIGTYSIGKERIALSIQENFLPLRSGNEDHRFVPTYVSHKKYRSLQELDYFPDRFFPFSQGIEDPSCGLRKHEVQLPEDTLHSSSTVARNLFPADQLGLTEESSEEIRYFLTPMLVPLSSVNFPSLAATCGKHIKRHRSDATTVDGVSDSQRKMRSSQEVLPLWENETIDLKQFDGVLCVLPTGWNKKTKKCQINTRITLLSVSYSEHSSFSELLDFVRFINPERVVPTVSSELFKRYEVLFAERAPRLHQQYSNTQPLSRFWIPKYVPKAGASPTVTAESKQIISAQLPKQRNPFAPAAVFKETNTISKKENSYNLRDFSLSEELNMKKREGDEYCSTQNFIKHELNSAVIDETSFSTYGGVNSVNDVKDNIEEMQQSLHKLRVPRTQTSLLCWAPSTIDSDKDDCVCVGTKPPIIDISDSSD